MSGMDIVLKSISIALVGTLVWAIGDATIGKWLGFIPSNLIDIGFAAFGGACTALTAYVPPKRDAAMRCEDCSAPVKPSDFPTLCDACLMDRVSVSSSGLMAEAV